MIDAFIKTNRFLSNFYPCKVTYEGITYPTTEHAFQAAKTLDQSLRKTIANLPQPSEAKKEGRNLQLRPDWEKIKVQVMRELLLLKFSDPELKKKLLATGKEELIEGNWWGDTFWGVCKGTGQNMLGKLLMEIRDKWIQPYSGI